MDLFSKDYIFVPIHGYLHWSLVLICHPGNLVQYNPAYVTPALEGGERAEEQREGNAMMLHMDSLDGARAFIFRTCCVSVQSGAMIRLTERPRL